MSEKDVSSSDIKQMYVRVGRRDTYVPIETYYGEEKMRDGVFVVGKYGKELYLLKRVDSSDLVATLIAKK